MPRDNACIVPASHLLSQRHPRRARPPYLLGPGALAVSNGHRQVGHARRTARPRWKDLFFVLRRE